MYRRHGVCQEYQDGGMIFLKTLKNHPGGFAKDCFASDLTIGAL